MHVYKAIIVGAGAAGIAAAKFFSENAIDFMVLEAQGHIGGRIKTQEFGKKPDGSNSLVELGAQWIHGEENDFFKFIKAGGFIHEKTSWEGQGDFITPDGTRICMEKVQKIVDWVNKQLDDLEDEPEVDLQNSPCHDKHSESVGEYLKRKFEEYLQENDELPKELQMAVFQWANSFHRIDNCCNQMTDLSEYRWADFQVNGGELYNNFLSGGSQALSKLSETFLTSSNLRLGREVKRINWETEEIQVFVNDSEFYLCHSIIITCSIGVLKESLTMFSPPLPQVMAEAIRKTGFGPLTKIFLEWEQPWWPSEGFEGYQLLWPQEFINCCDDIDDGSDEEKIKIAERWHKSITGFDPVLDNPNVLLAWLGGPEAVHVETLNETFVGDKCAEILSQFIGIHVPSPKAVVISKWTSNSHVRGAYCYRSTEGDSLGEGIISTLQQPIFNSDDNGIWKPALIFAGEALHKSQYSTLHGAFASGAEQAEKLLQLIRLWEKQRSDSE